MEGVKTKIIAMAVVGLVMFALWWVTTSQTKPNTPKLEADQMPIDAAAIAVAICAVWNNVGSGAE